MTTLLNRFIFSISIKIVKPFLLNNINYTFPTNTFIPVPLHIQHLWCQHSLFKDDTKPKSIVGLDKHKVDLVLELKFQSPEDALPFYNLPFKTLIHIYKTTKNDREKGFCDNRLYYISSRLKVPPTLISKQLAKRIFVFSLSFEWLKKSLDVLLEMGVNGDRIIRDLWVLKYHHETIREKLQKAKNSGMDNLYPWMVRCSEDIMNRSIALSQETKHILGNTKSTQIYLANRLNISAEETAAIYDKLPALKTIRVTKVKNFLDFLVNEGFSTEDISRKPRVLSASQRTVKKRLEMLRKLGLTHINLNVLCRSKKDFKKYYDSLEQAVRW